MAPCRATAPSSPFDLVICYDVLQYLEMPPQRGALANLARLCRGVLYFTALTAGDWRWNCDQRRTDSNVHLRSGAVVPLASATRVSRDRRRVLVAARRAAHGLGTGVRA